VGIFSFFSSTNVETKNVCPIAYNDLRLGEGCLTETLIFAQNLMEAFAKPLLCAGRFISTKFNLKRNDYYSKNERR
jgi:hypothetical protein